MKFRAALKRLSVQNPLFWIGSFLGASALWALAHIVVITVDGLNDEPPVGDPKTLAAIVPGNTVTPAGRPSERLQARLDAAIALYKQGSVGTVVLSGATGREGPNESLVMAAYCREQGLADSVLVVDLYGVNTAATARFAAAEARRRGWTGVVGVSHYYHQTRFRLALRQAGAPVAGMVHSPAPVEWREPKSLLREWVGFYVYWL